jgi:hypothetical protein
MPHGFDTIPWGSATVKAVEFHDASAPNVGRLYEIAEKSK